MAQTNPFPRLLTHQGAAKPLQTVAATTVGTSGAFTITVEGNAAQNGWPGAIATDTSMVITVGRGQPFEAKYLVSAISSQAAQSVLTVSAAGRGYDGTIPQNIPSGAVVEHTVSATEMAQFNTHARSKSQHGADGDLIDQNSAQTLTNKTFTAPVIPGLKAVPVGAVMMWAQATPPQGWLVCNGATFDATTYPLLASVLAGNTLPNLVGAYVKGGSAPAAISGSNDRALSVANMPSHSHGVAATASQYGHNHGGSTGAAGAHSHGFSGQTGPQPAPQGTGNTYRTLQGGGARDVVGYDPFGSVAQGHVHSFSGRTDDPGNWHGHAIGAEAPGIVVNVTQSAQGSGTAFNIEPRNAVLCYIICATDK